ncbi:MAG TPA: efflux RND transporter periplasmic adaptor subunit [Candidatus Eisenbacteria bacterium]
MSPVVVPKIRSGLTIREQPTADGRVFVVKDPVSGEFFRLGEAERFIAGQCDGVTSVEQMRRRTEERFGASLPLDALESFLGSLDRAGLLEGPGSARAPRPKRRVFWARGNPLHLRFPLCDPDALLGRLVGRLAFLFTPGFLVLSAATLLLAISIVVTNWTELRADLGGLYRLSAIPLIWITVAAVIAAHELAHGLTCKRFGGEVHELGLLLIYLQPAAYCNVSDAWLFPERSRRLWVTFAGPWFELFLWGLATLLWHVTNPETLVGRVALIVVATSGVKQLLNLNPLLKLDGYYLLSDLLEIPNLRGNAFRAIGDRVRKLWGRAPASAREPTARERRIYLAYGLVAVVFSFSLLAFAVAKLGRYVVRDQPSAAVLAIGLLGVKAPRKFGKLFGKSDPADDDDFDAGPAEEARGDGMAPNAAAPPPAAARKRAGLPGRRARLLALALVAPLILLAPLDLKIRGPFDALAGREANLRAEVEGIVEEVAVSEGGRVRAGDLIARLSARDLLAERGDVESRLEQGGARLRMLEAGPRPAEADVARAAVARAQGHFRFARKRLEVSRQLFATGAISRRDLEQAEEETVTAEGDLGEAREKLRLLLSGSRPEEIEATRAEIEGLEVRRRLLDEQLRQVDVRSPIDGIVATPEVELRELRDRHLEKGDPIATVIDDRTIAAVIAVPEQDIADVAVGQTVLVKARAHPGVTFRGKVTAIGATAQGGGASGSGQLFAGVPAGGRAPPRTVLVRTDIDNRARLLKPQMTGQAKILCGRRSVLDLLTRGLSRLVRVEFWSWS